MSMSPEGAVHDRLVRLEVVPIGDGVLAGERAALPNILEALEVGLAALDASDPCAQHGNQLKPARSALRIRQELADARKLIALDVHQEHVRAVGARAHLQLVEQARLHRPHADDEEGAKADGEQDDPGLIAGAGNVQDGVAKGK
jgi:hypothetical protein